MHISTLLYALAGASLAMAGARDPPSLHRRARSFGNPHQQVAHSVAKRDASSQSAPHFVVYSDMWANQGSPPPAVMLAGWNVFALSFWLVSGAADMALGWAGLTDAQRSGVKQDYANNGIKLIVSAFGATDTPTSSGADPTDTAHAVAKFVKDFGLDGVDVDYEDFAAMSAGTAEPWLITFIKELRSSLGPEAILSVAPLAPWFSTDTSIYPGGGFQKINKDVGDLVTIYNTQLYNQGTSEYTDCAGLLEKSTAWPGTCLFEIAAGGVELNKIVIGKPATPSDASNGYMDAKDLGVCVAQARKKNWNGGLMLWQFPHVPVDFLTQAWGSSVIPPPETSATSTSSSALSTTTVASSSTSVAGSSTASSGTPGTSTLTSSSASPSGTPPPSSGDGTSLDCSLPVDTAGGTCGGKTGFRCSLLACCSSNGNCGYTDPWCGTGCQSAPLYVTDSGQLFHAGQILLAFVGLPARGKTHVSRSVERYLRWLGVKVEVFSLGDYRRELLGPSSNLPSDYFHKTERTPETEKLRLRVKVGLEDAVAQFFQTKRGQVAIYDANNGQHLTRRDLRVKFEGMGVNVVFIENICDREDIVEANIRSVKLSSPDYAGWDSDEAVKNYMARIAHHAKHYETIEASVAPFVKIYNVGERLVINNIQGYLQSRIVFHLMNVHHKKRTIWFARSGQSQIEHSYKADSDLSAQGVEYSESLRDFIIEKRRELREERMASGEQSHERRLTIWTSARRRCLSTCQPLADLGYKVIERQQMYELNPGVIDGLSVEEIKARYPDEYERSLKETYSHRYPRGESYHDLSVRLEPVILELEREPADVLLIGHGSVIRCLMAYLQGLTPQEIPSVELRRGDVVQVSPSAYGVKFTTHFFYQ